MNISKRLMTKRQWALLVALSIFASLLAVPISQNVFAETSSDLQTQLNEANKSINDITKQLNQAQAKEKDAMAALEEIELELEDIRNQIKAQEKKLSESEKELNATKNEISKAEKEIEKLERELSNKLDEIATVLREVYMNGGVDYLEFLLASSSLSDLVANYKYVDCVMNDQMDMFNRVLEAKDNLENKRDQLGENRVKLETNKTNIENIKAGLKSEESKVATKASEREYYLALVQKDIEKYKKDLAEEKAMSKELEARIRQFQSNDTVQYS